MLKYIFNYALDFVHYMHIFIQMMTLRSVDILVSQIILYSLIHSSFKLLPYEVL